MRHEFVEFIPDTISPETLYVSIAYDTVVHLCACGCNTEVVTPLSPAEWAITYDGRTVSLWPSIGNWNLPCRSHYIVRQGKVVWARDFTPAEIRKVQSRDRLDRSRVYGGSDLGHQMPRPIVDREESNRAASEPEVAKRTRTGGLWNWIKNKFT